MPFAFNPFTGTLDAVTDPIDEPCTFFADCSAGEAIGDCVYVSADAVSGVLQVRKADVSDSSKMPAVGVILEKPTATSCVAVYLGSFPSAGLLPGKRYFVGSTSQLASSPPAAPALIQIVGVALDSGRLLFNPSPTMMKIT